MNLNHPDSEIEVSRFIIATTQPKLFAPSFTAQLGRSVSIFDTGSAAVAALREGGCRAFFADFRQLEDRWTGQRFLRFIRDRAEFNQVAFWIMADHWHPSQEERAIKGGANGILKRSPQVLATRILGRGAQRSLALGLRLDAIDAVYGRFAGPMRGVQTLAAREAMESGQIEATREAYVQHLASQFTLAERRDAFLKALLAESEVTHAVATTQPGDPWMTEINQLFRRYAGALGANLIIPEAQEAMGKQGTHERSVYANCLCEGLVNELTRQEFLEAAKAAKLIG